MIKPTPYFKDKDAVAELMDRHLSNLGVNKKVKVNLTEFMQFYLDRMLTKVIDNGERVPLPLNLGYLQALEHLYPGDDVNHLKTYGNRDYSVVWMKHPMFRFHRIKENVKLNDRLRSKVREKMEVRKEAPRGDTFVR